MGHRRPVAASAPACVRPAGTKSPRASTPTCLRAAPWVRPATAPHRCSAPKASSWARWDSGRRWRPEMWLCPRCGSAAAGYPLTKAPPREYHDFIRGRSRRWMLPRFQHWSSHTEAPGRVLLGSCSRTFKVPAVLSFQVREELEAQLSRFRELLGRDPTHVDGHQHVHVLPGALVGGPRQGAVCLGWVGDAPRWRNLFLPDSAPPAGVCQVFAEVLQAHGVRFTRLPLEHGVGDCTWLEAPARAFARSVERDARAAMGPFSSRGLR